MDEFEDFVKKTYLHRVNTFPWGSVCDAIHNSYAHTVKKMRKIGGYGLGDYSEQRLEASNKILRCCIKNHCRRCCVYHKMVDCLNHMWIKTDPVYRKFKRVPESRAKEVPKNEDDIIVESFIVKE